jgi:hypothetical protein
VFHSQEATNGFVEALVAEISQRGHWLEGARIKEHLSGACLSGARLPGATFEGRTLRGVALDNALLEGANFRSSHLKGTSLYGSNLRRAAFDLATFQDANGFPVDLRNAELGGASFSGATLVSPRMFGSRFSEPTPIERFLDAPIFEMAHGSWDEAAVVYSALAKRASEDWDFSSEEIAAYLAMTCKHRKALGAQPLSHKNHWRNWVSPTVGSGLTGVWWMVHRVGWGYGLRPSRVLALMVAVILFFGLLVFPFAGVEHTRGTRLPPVLEGLVLSLTTFVTLTYGRHLPSTTLGEVAGGVEAFFGAILIALFLVALAGKYLRRF